MISSLILSILFTPSKISIVSTHPAIIYTWTVPTRCFSNRKMALRFLSTILKYIDTNSLVTSYPILLTSILDPPPSNLTNRSALTAASLGDSWHETYLSIATSIRCANLVPIGLGLQPLWLWGTYPRS